MHGHHRDAHGLRVSDLGFISVEPLCDRGILIGPADTRIPIQGNGRQPVVGEHRLEFGRSRTAAIEMITVTGKTADFDAFETASGLPRQCFVKGIMRVGDRRCGSDGRHGNWLRTVPVRRNKLPTTVADVVGRLLISACRTDV